MSSTGSAYQRLNIFPIDTETFAALFFASASIDKEWYDNILMVECPEIEVIYKMIRDHYIDLCHCCAAFVIEWQKLILFLVVSSIAFR